MDENEFNDIIAEGLFPEDNITYITISNCISNFHLSDHVHNVRISTHLDERLEKMEKQIKQLEKNYNRTKWGK